MTPKRIRNRKVCRRFDERTALPCFRPDSPEDSLFLPRCRHARSSPCALGAGKMGRLPMTIKASGRSALIIAAGIWACFAGPLQAAEGADNATASVSKQESKAAGAPIVLKKYTKSRSAQRQSSKAALKSTPESTTDKKATEADAADNSGDSSTAIPPSVANANAQLAAADTPIRNASAMSARADNILAAVAE